MYNSYLATRLYDVAGSLKALATLMDDATDSPLAPLLRFISNEVESCAEEAGTSESTEGTPNKEEGGNG